MDLNEPATVELLVGILKALVHDEANAHQLEVQGVYYFNIPDGPVTRGAGWYIICDEDRDPIYIPEFHPDFIH